MYFTVEEENLICLYHNADRRRTAANLRAALPDMDKEMAALACQTADTKDLSLVNIHDGFQIAHTDAARGLHGKAVGGGHVAGKHFGHPGRAGGNPAAALPHQDTDAIARFPLAQLAENLNGFLRGKIPIGIAVNHHHRGQGAAAQTGHLVEGKHSVFRGLPIVDSQFLGNSGPNAF